jgi:hypothetical protein
MHQGFVIFDANKRQTKQQDTAHVNKNNQDSLEVAEKFHR